MAEKKSLPKKNNYSKNSQIREKHYNKYLGECSQVYHEIIPLDPHIDVYPYEPTKKRTYQTLISSGMSDKIMPVPEGIDPVWGRAEVILNCTHATYKQQPEIFANLVRVYAGFAHQHDTFLFHSHTVQGYHEDKTLFPDLDKRFKSIMLIGAVHFDEAVSMDFFSKLKVEDDQIKFHYLIPLTQKEVDYKLNKGFDSLLDKFDEKHIDFLVFDINRKAAV